MTLRVCVSAYVRGVAQCVGGGKCFLFQGRWCLCAPCVCNTLLFFFFFFFHLLWDPGCDWRVVCVCVWCAYACACARALMCVLFLCLYLCLSLSLSLNLMVFSYPLFFFCGEEVAVVRGEGRVTVQSSNAPNPSNPSKSSSPPFLSADCTFLQSSVCSPCSAIER